MNTPDTGGAPPALAAQKPGDHLQALVQSLGTVILGTHNGHGQGPLANPRTASAFAPGSSCRPVGLGEGLWALVRASADGANRVLCVHNLTGDQSAFTPDGHLPPTPRREPLLFLHGATATDEADGTTICRVQGHGFVWLGRFAGAPGPDTNGEPE